MNRIEIVSCCPVSMMIKKVCLMFIKYVGHKFWKFLTSTYLTGLVNAEEKTGNSDFGWQTRAGNRKLGRKGRL